MNIQRFHAPTSREALAKARQAFGEGTVILMNRPTTDGVEVLATAEDALASLDASAAPVRQEAPQAAAAPAKAAAPARPSSSTNIAEDTERLAMSTLSFQDYVRERMLRRKHADRSEKAAAVAAALNAPDRFEHMIEPTMSAASAAPTAAPIASVAVPFKFPAAEVEPTLAEVAAQISAPVAQPTPMAHPVHVPSQSNDNVMSEIHAMRELIDERFNALSWLSQAKQDPIQSSLMLKLIRAGYSPTLSRALLEKMPADVNAVDSIRWVMNALARNLKTDTANEAMKPIHEEGGVYALVGATGVGKTTTAAKLAGLCARKYGAASVGLITLDTYRVAAHDQLRAYGRMLGVVAHLAHDRAALQDLLGLLANKKMVLIDTTGVAPRDPRKRGMLDVLDIPKVNRLMVLNAGGQGDTLDDVLTSFKTTGEGAPQAVLSKIDEAVKLGPALDTLIRHQILLRGVTNGQRVPEDWDAADATKLVAQSMRSPVRSAFDPKPLDLNFYFSPAGEQRAVKESIDA